MKNLICLMFLVGTGMMGTGCVMTPMGDIYSAPIDVEAEVGGELGPRVHVGTRSAVTVWLHPNFHLYDAYPIAQRHCSRWGYFARPRNDWSITAGQSRYLDYTCVRRRPHLAARHYRRGTFGRRGTIRSNPSRRYDRKYPNYPRRVITPKPTPRIQAPARRRGTFGGIFKSSPKRGTVVERGKPWEHNRRKGGIVTRPVGKKTVVERGKAWEHNSRKGGIKGRYNGSSRGSLKRSTLGSSRSKIVEKKRVEKKTITKYKSKPSIGKKKYGGLKSKKGSSRKGTLSL